MTQTAERIAEAIASTTPAMRAQVGAVAVVATLALLPVLWLAVKRLVPGRNIVFARWGFSHVALAVLVFLSAMFVGAFFVTEDSGLGALLLVSVGAFAATVAAIAAWAIRLDPEGVRVLGLRGAGVGRALSAAVLAYVATLPGILGVVAVWHWLLELLGVTAEPQQVVARFVELPPDERALPIALGVLVQPLFEEIVFRSFLQPLFVQNFREVAGVGLTSLCFAAVHGVEVFLPIFALSCLLGAVMLRTQSLWAVWLIHALNNGIMFAVLVTAPELAQTGAAG